MRKCFKKLIVVHITGFFLLNFSSNLTAQTIRLDSKNSPNLSELEKAILLVDFKKINSILNVHSKLNLTKDFLAKNIKIFLKLLTKTSQENKKTVFMIIEYAFNHGAEIDAQNHNGETLLHLAVQTLNLDLVNLCFLHGANPKVKNNQSRTPYDLLVQKRFKTDPLDTHISFKKLSTTNSNEEIEKQNFWIDLIKVAILAFVRGCSEKTGEKIAK